LRPASPRSLRVHRGGRRICATPPSDSEAIIVPPGHAVKRCVVLAADLEAVRGAIQPDVGACVVAWLRAANATNRARSTRCGTSSFRDPVPGWPPYPHHLPCSSGSAGIPRGRGHIVTKAVRPATRWIRVVSRVSARGMAGRMVGKRRASIDVPAPGGPRSRRCGPRARSRAGETPAYASASPPVDNAGHRSPSSRETAASSQRPPFHSAAASTSAAPVLHLSPRSPDRAVRIFPSDDVLMPVPSDSARIIEPRGLAAPRNGGAVGALKHGGIRRPSNLSAHGSPGHGAGNLRWRRQPVQVLVGSGVSRRSWMSAEGMRTDRPATPRRPLARGHSSSRAIRRCMRRYCCLIRTNHSKGWDARPLAYVPQARDRAAGLPGTHSTSDGAVCRARPR